VNELDPIRDEGVAFAEKCELASVPTELRLVKGQVSFYLIYMLRGVFRHTAQAVVI
jgi:acetyl esterase/lipase